MKRNVIQQGTAQVFPKGTKASVVSAPFPTEEEMQGWTRAKLLKYVLERGLPPAKKSWSKAKIIEHILR